MMDYETVASIKLEELKKYLRYYALSENAYDKREFALELLLKLGAGFGAAQSQGASPSVEKSDDPSLGMDTKIIR